MLRGLIVLLALMPLVPAGLMLRLQVQNAERDRNQAITEQTSTFQSQLALSVSRLSMTTRPGEASEESMRDYVRYVFGEDVSLSIYGTDGALLLREGEIPSDTSIQAIPFIGGYKDWLIVLDHVAVIPDHIGEQLREAWRSSLILVGVVTLAAGIVWFATNRGLAVDELRADLIATVSHEMRTPLASMRVLLETMEDAGESIDPIMREEYLQLMTRENDRLTRLAEHFLAWSRLEKGETQLSLSPVSLAEVVDRVLASYAERFEEVDGSAEAGGVNRDIVVHSDTDALFMVLSNLIENGLKYGGSPPVLTVRTAPDGSLVVGDNGPGVPREIRRRVFGRYFQGERRLSDGTRGVGLGLAICRQLMRKMKGRIEIVDTEGGTEFWLRFQKSET